MRKKLICALLVVPQLLILGCSSHLSNSKAEKIIQSSIAFPKTESEPIEYGLMAYDFDSLPKFYYILQQKGMFTIEHLGKGGFLVMTYRFRVSLTPEAKKYLVEEDKNPVKQGDSGEHMYNSRFKTCDVTFGEIKDIHEIPEMNAAEIQYNVKRTNFTPFWNFYLDKHRRMPDTIQTRKFAVMKTNDGWKPAS